MPAPDPVEDLDITQDVATVPIGTLSWTHPSPGDVDRFALVYEIDDTQVILEPQPKASFGAGPYEATVAIRTEITWGVLAINADGEYSL